jgi:quercetin dioxygenase-like cupin family protein
MTEKTMIAYEDMQFAPISEGSPIEVAMLWGDPENGPVTVLVRFPEGYAEPWHNHSSTYRSVLIRGKFQTRSNMEEPTASEVFNPGSYVVQPGGEVHAEVNAGEGEMVALVHFEGPIDFVLAE